MTASAIPELAIPPLDMRRLVGREDPADFDNPSRSLVYAYLPSDVYSRVLDFGCGCGRIARQLIQQVPRPQRYLGIDLHRGMIEWCRANLEVAAPGFEFRHHDVFNASFNPGQGKPAVLPFPAEDRSFTLVDACSVFTHLTQSQTEHYLREVARVLEPRGVLNATWFFFDKRDYPMLAEAQNALYTNECDLGAAVIFDREWVRRTAAEAGLTVVQVLPPAIRNFHWTVVMSPAGPGVEEVEFPPDEAPVGASPPPPMPADPTRIGLDAPIMAPPLVMRYPPPERPWTHEYVELHRRFVGDMLDDPRVMDRFARGDELPAGYGVGLDERVVEFPWLLSRGVRGRVLDAGSALNHEHILDRVLPSVDELHVVTLEPEEQAFPEKRVSYVYGDLRDLPYRDGWFDTVVCLSTLEHVGMDNTLYGVAEPRAADPDRELRRAADELVRVAAPAGRILLTVPYGRREDHGWFHQFDRRDVEALLARIGGVDSIAVFRYGEDGWQVSDLDGAAESRYRDFLADPSPVPDRAAAARAVVCVSAARQSARA